MHFDYQLGLYEKAMPTGLSFERMLDLTAECGFDTLELSIDETNERLQRLVWTARQRQALWRASVRAGVPIKTMCLSGHRQFSLGARDEAVRERAVAMLDNAVQLAMDTGIRIIQLAGYDVYYEPGDARTRAYFGENLQRCVEIAARAGILLGFETMETPFMDTVAKAMRWVRKVRSPYLGVYPDIGNLHNASLLYKTSLHDDISTGRGHIFAAHLKETRPGVYREMAFGSGCTAYVPCIRQLYGMGVRHFTGEFWYDGSDDYESVIRQSACFLRDKIDEAIREQPSAANPG